MICEFVTLIDVIEQKFASKARFISSILLVNRIRLRFALL